MMDSNINLLKTDHPSPSINFIQNAIENGFIQSICKVTRICNEKTSLIDHIFTNSKNINITSGTIINDISDHFITFIVPQLSSKNAKRKPVISRDMSTQQISKFKASLSNLSWQDVRNSKNVDESYEIFWNDFKPLYEIHFPAKTVPFNKNVHKINNFMTKGLLISRLRKNALLKASLALRNANASLAYKKYRNIFNSLIRASKLMYYKDQLSKNKKNPKKIWQIIKEVSTGSKSVEKIEKITVNNVTTDDPAKISEHFNKFFSEVGKQISESVLPTQKKADQFINENQEIPPLDLGNTGPIHVSDFIKSFDPKKSKDFDGLSMFLLKNIATEISVPLAHIFNLSLETGTFPSKLKQSRTVPVFKSGNPESCDNYRPISLLSSLSKILEKMVANRLVNHLELNNLLYKHQYGFLRGKCTEHNLLHVTNFIGKALNEGKYCVGLFLDLKKAFDVCSHEILVAKLEKLGIRGVALDWFKSYLKNRMQCVDINGNVSLPRAIDISVLQGSILGPILFLCYINDLPSATTLLTFLFADDTSGLIAGENLPELINNMNTEINKLANWFRANKMAVNIGKTKYCIFHPRSKKVDLQGLSIVYNNNEIGMPIDPSLITPLSRVYDNSPIAENRSYKLLGIQFDEHLTFNTHVSYLCNKLSRALFCIKRAKHLLNAFTLKLLYYSLFHSNLIYCIGTLSAMSNANAAKILKIQKKAIRTISNAKYNSPSKPLYAALKILPYDLLQKQAKLNFMHSVEYEYAPRTFFETWSKNASRNLNYELRNTALYDTPRLKYEYLRNSPFISFPTEWNKLHDVRFQTNKITFQIALKDHLLESP